MKHVFLFILLNLTGIITYKIINNKNNKNNKNTTSTNSKTEICDRSISTQTDLSNTDMLILLEYKKALENIYDDNQKYEWKFV